LCVPEGSRCSNHLLDPTAYPAGRVKEGVKLILFYINKANVSMGKAYSIKKGEEYVSYLEQANDSYSRACNVISAYENDFPEWFPSVELTNLWKVYRARNIIDIEQAKEAAEQVW
jgi:hypothetical protein